MSAEKPVHFIQKIIAQDVADGLHDGRVRTRFPPEPNGYLHIGHAKSICLNFGMAREFGGECNLRFDDTNPEKESPEYVESIKRDVSWLGFNWARECYASDYFEQLYAWAEQLIERGLAYVCDLDPATMRAYRGTLTEPGRNSPYRERSSEENLDLFRRMRAGEFADGSRVLRAKIDMAHPNLNLRDPALYRIRRVHHHRTGDQWCIYPTYDYTHGQSDSIEGITHSICTLEFEDHRPLYNWFIESLGIFPSRQYEFARLNLTHTVMSKRLLLRLVQEGHVKGWDDPRMPTISGMRRRGYPPEAIRLFCERIGVTKFNGTTDFALLEHSVREVLNQTAERRMVVFEPLPVTITNLNEDITVTANNNPEDDSAGSRLLTLGPKLLIEQKDFMEDAPKKFFRLAPGREVRLRHGFIIRCDEVEKDASGHVTGLRCTADLDTLGKNPADRKVKGVIHWVNASLAQSIEVRQYDKLFLEEKPGHGERDFVEEINPKSLTVVTALAEESMGALEPGKPFQFERVGYFTVDADSNARRPVFNRTTLLRDSSS